MAERTREERATRSLIAAANYVKRGPGAIQARGGEVARPIVSQRDILYEYCLRRGEVLNSGFTSGFNYLGEGAEHVVLFDYYHRRAVKITHPNRFGWSISDGFAQPATPFEYLRRLIYQNWFFGDDIELVGVIGAEGHMEVVTSQPYIDVDRTNPPANEAQIRAYFNERGFTEIQYAECGGMFYQRDLDVIAADAHSRNVLVSSAG
jgi:hypothetical protein